MLEIRRIGRMRNEEVLQSVRRSNLSTLCSNTRLNHLTTGYGNMTSLHILHFTTVTLKETNDDNHG